MTRILKPLPVFFHSRRCLSNKPSFIETNSNHQVITPQNVLAQGSGIDYDRLIQEFGCNHITSQHLETIQKITSPLPLNHLLKRQIFYSHRDLDIILDEYSKKKPKFFIYTGRGPSSHSIHLGHLLPFFFTKYLQEAFKVPTIIQITDDEKYFFRDLTLEQIKFNVQENCKDIIACGFDLERTFIFSDMDYIGKLYPNVVKIQKLVSNRLVRNTFGITHKDNIGQNGFPAIQAAPSFSSSFPIVLNDSASKPRRCLIPCGIDQDPYFRLTRDILPRLGPNYLKPSLIHSKFFPSLQGIGGKMSSSQENSAIFLTDSPNQIKAKLMGSFSGGRRTLEEHRIHGANLAVDVSYQYLQFFLEDDEELEKIGKKYSTGVLTSSEVKKIAIDVIVPLVEKHQKKRATITESDIQQFMKERPLKLE